MQELLKRLCVWYLSRFYPVVHTGIKIDTDWVKVKWGGYVPDDLDWHHQAVTITSMVQRGSKEAKYTNVTLYRDGEMIEKSSKKTKK